jgi:hypothetical protein
MGHEHTHEISAAGRNKKPLMIALSLNRNAAGLPAASRMANAGVAYV